MYSIHLELNQNGLKTKFTKQSITGSKNEKLSTKNGLYLQVETKIYFLTTKLTK